MYRTSFYFLFIYCLKVIYSFAICQQKTTFIDIYDLSEDFTYGRMARLFFGILSFVRVSFENNVLICKRREFVLGLF
jgi:hypothetical protein